MLKRTLFVLSAVVGTGLLLSPMVSSAAALSHSVRLVDDSGASATPSAPASGNDMGVSNGDDSDAMTNSDNDDSSLSNDDNGDDTITDEGNDSSSGDNNGE